MVNIENNPPWDIKQIKISLGGEDDEFGFIVFEIFNDDRFSMREGHEDDPKWFVDDMDIDVARRLRDFLNYAVPEQK